MNAFVSLTLNRDEPTTMSCLGCSSRDHGRRYRDDRRENEDAKDALHDDDHHHVVQAQRVAVGEKEKEEEDRSPAWWRRFTRAHAGCWPVGHLAGWVGPSGGDKKGIGRGGGTLPAQYRPAQPLFSQHVFQPRE